MTKPMTGCCVQGNEFLGPVMYETFVDQLRTFVYTRKNLEFGHIYSVCSIVSFFFLFVCLFLCCWFVYLLLADCWFHQLVSWVEGRQPNVLRSSHVTYVGQFPWDKELACNRICIVDVMNLCLVFPDITFVPASYWPFCSHTFCFSFQAAQNVASPPLSLPLIC